VPSFAPPLSHDCPIRQRLALKESGVLQCLGRTAAFTNLDVCPPAECQQPVSWLRFLAAPWATCAPAWGFSQPVEAFLDRGFGGHTLASVRAEGNPQGTVFVPACQDIPCIIDSPAYVLQAGRHLAVRVIHLIQSD